ncbi:hypothetical protein [Noviherbaspirillum sp. ST9]|uniref:hypothetical protein n=1 Tax=Noviherbaspirillum sp. ST9 TaxID=3401606 RepID=UPI003B589F80
MKPNLLLRQRGATLVVGLIMLALITLTVTTALTLNSTNLKSVGNMQVRNEAIAAANNAIEQVISGPFAVTPSSTQISIDIDNDDAADYIVDVNVPTCLYNVSETTSAGTGFYTDVETPGFESAPPTFNTLWDIQAVVRDARSSTTIVTVHQGVRRSQLPQLQTSASCPGPTT